MVMSVTPSSHWAHKKSSKNNFSLALKSAQNEQSFPDLEIRYELKLNSFKSERVPKYLPDKCVEPVHAGDPNKFTCTHH